MSSEIKLKYKNASDIFIKKDENISDVRLNEAFNKLLINDKTLSPLNNIEPKLWECRWYNNNAIEGYPAGTAVWYNTESVDEIIVKKHSDIYDYAIANTRLANKITEYDPTNEECYNLYKSIVTGYYDEDFGIRLQPLYDVGTLSDHVQIYILQKDGSKISPSEDLLLPEEKRVWKPFFKTNENIVEEILSAYSDYLFDSHIKQYHLGKYAFNPEKSFVNTYLKKDLTNIDPNYVQRIESHVVKKSTEGFDFVKRYVRDYVSSDINFTEDKIVNLYYGQTTNTITYNLSIGANFDADPAHIKSQIAGVINYQETEPYINRLTTDKQAFGDIFFQLSSNYKSSYSYPFIVDYSERYKINGLLSKYSVGYNVYDLTKTSKEILNDPNYYPTTTPISGYYRGYSPSEMIDPVPSGFKLNETPVSSYIDTVITPGFRIEEPTKWFKLWNSGYLEHGGIITIPEGEDTIISVNLDWTYNGQNAPIYDYETDTPDAFYGLYTEYSDANGKKYNQDGCIDKTDRYTITLTPVGDIENTVGVTEVTMIRNNGFCIKLDNKASKTRVYRYYTSGFVQTGLEG